MGWGPSQGPSFQDIIVSATQTAAFLTHFPTTGEQVAFVSQGPGQAPQGTRPCGKPASSSIVFSLWVWLFHSLDWAQDGGVPDSDQ